MDQETSAVTIHQRLRLKYLIVALLANSIDWLQGPYLYHLYSSFGYARNDISTFYVTGFFSSAISGVLIGYFADRLGRKKFCLLYFITSIVTCSTVFTNNYLFLHIGRVFGGISAAILFSSFESWYVGQHLAHYRLKKEWMGSTLTQATFCNSLIAIFAGFLCSILVETFNLGPQAPYIVVLPLATISGGLCAITWDENMPTKVYSSLFQGFDVVFSRKNRLIIHLGIIQTLFETVMYIFVVLWTPILDPVHLYNGLIFACFMICIMLGSVCYATLTDKYQISPDISLSLCLVLALVSFLAATLGLHIQTYASYEVVGSYVCLVSFLGLELAVGCYYPAIGYLRGVIVPECHRTGVATWLRVPSSILISLVLLYVTYKVPDNHVIFGLCTVALGIAVVYSLKFIKKYSREDSYLNDLIVFA